jgi:hypothetical protein
MAGEAPSIPRHYGLHAWLFRDNPDGLFAVYNAGLEPSPLVERIAPVRETLADYRIGADAREAGYTNTEACIATAGGGYGVPFVRDDGAGGTDPENPPVLLYRVTTNWTYLLMGAEWYVPTADADGPPSLFGERFHDAAAGHSPKTDQPEHYGLHAWLFHANPDGLFAPFNPTVTC